MENNSNGEGTQGSDVQDGIDTAHRTRGTVNIYNIRSENGIVTAGDGTSVNATCAEASAPSTSSCSSVSTVEMQNVKGEDVVEKVSRFVCEDYRRKCASVKPFPWGQKKPINTFFINVDLKCVNYGCEKLQGDQLMYRIFKLQEDSCTRVILCGSPGIGKTTWCQKYVYEWAKRCEVGEPNINEEKVSFPQFKVVFFLKLYEVKGTLHEIMEEHIFCKRLNKEEKAVFFEYMLSHPKHFLFILDGINECNLDKLPDIKQILEDAQYRGVYLIATSRPELESELIDKQTDHFNALYCVKGYSDKNVLAFIDTYLKEHQERCELLKEEIRNNTNLMHLGRIPLLTPIICELWMDDQFRTTNLPTMTQLLTHYVKVVCRMFTLKTSQKNLEEEIRGLGRLALDGVLNNSMQYSSRQLHDFNVNETACKLGFLNTEPSFSSDLGETQFHCFAHRSIQEFLAAMWLLENWSTEECQNTVSSMLEDDSKFYSILVLICGLLSKDHEKADSLAAFFHQLAGDVFKKGCYSLRMQLVLECCYEAWQCDGFFFDELISQTRRKVLFVKVETNWGFTLQITFRAVQGLSLIMPLLKFSTLDLSDILIETREAKQLATSCLEKSPLLTAVKFSNCCLSPDAVESICTSVKDHSNLALVDFSGCNLSDKGMIAVANLMSETITSLRLGNHPGTTYKRTKSTSSCDKQPDLQADKKPIINTLYAFHTQVHSSSYTDDAIKHLMEAVRNNKSLQEISLLCCHIGSLFLEWLAVFKENKDSLKKIRIQLRYIDDALYEELVKFASDMPEHQKMRVIFKDGSNSVKMQNNVNNKIELVTRNHITTALSWTDLIFDSFFPE